MPSGKRGGDQRRRTAPPPEKTERTDMVFFENDYGAGAHPAVLRRLIETNGEALPGYGADPYSLRAKEKIRKAIGLPDAGVEFTVGGTQTNALAVAAMLRDWEGVIAAESGHINVHEAGAIEYTGHKVLTLPQHSGKIAPSELSLFLENFYADGNREHTVFPGMVYISHPTEYGTLYTKKELTELQEICRTYGIPLYLDGARLGYALESEASDLRLEEIARLCDVFYVGGTKVGALCGEALIFTRGNRPEHFLTSVKKRGALLAKGRLVGVQFDALFTDGLYFEISRHAIGMAKELKRVFEKRRIPLFIDSPTNQQFVVLENGVLEKLRETVAFSVWDKYDDARTVVRFVTGWSTEREDLKALEAALDGAGRAIANA